MQSVGEKVCTLVDGRKFPFGLMVWSTGLAPLDLVKKMDVAKDRGRIAIDDWLRVTVLEGVFAMGDAAVNPQKPLGPLAQVADQQGKVRNGVLRTNTTRRTLRSRGRFTFDKRHRLPRLFVYTDTPLSIIAHMHGIPKLQEAASHDAEC